MMRLSLIKTVLLVLLVFGLAIWGAVTLGFASEAKAGEETESAWALNKRYAPEWWKRFSKWFLPIWVVLFLVYLILDRLSGRSA